MTENYHKAYDAFHRLNDTEQQVLLRALLRERKGSTQHTVAAHFRPSTATRSVTAAKQREARNLSLEELDALIYG